MRLNTGGDPQLLYEQLLELVEKEKRALINGDLGELEACVRRKAEFVSMLRQLEGKETFNEPSACSEKAAALLKQIFAEQERVKNGISVMLNECRDAILELRSGQRAHRAYRIAARKTANHSAKQIL